MAVNLKTAKALGLAIPQAVLLRANHVVESRLVRYRSRISAGEVWVTERG
jgi:hypothetical protein